MNSKQIQPENKVIVFGRQIPIEIFDFFKTAGIVLVICMFVYLFIATPNQVEGDSMFPTLQDHELIVTDRLNQWLGNLLKGTFLDYKRGDIVVFQKPGYKDFVKRIVGLPGEKVSIKNGHVTVNEIELGENYIHAHTTLGGDFILGNGNEVVIPDNYFLVLGDNRSDSLDSRYSDIGLINRDWLKGKVILRYWPFSRLNLFQIPYYNI